MFNYLINSIISNLIYFALHVTGGNSFPKPLSKEEETLYLEKMKEGDKEAYDKLIEHNLRLVAHIVKKYYSCGKEQDDLISIGTIGLIKGIKTFDNSKQIRLATYASRCIENEILMSLRSQKKNQQDVYINDPLDFDKEGNPLTLIDIISEDDNIVEKIDTKIKITKLDNYINKALNPREKLIIFSRYGLFGYKEKTQNEIATELNISRSYVSRIEKKALSKLRKCYDSKN